MKKNLIYILLAAIIIMSMVMVGCSPTNDSSISTTDTTTADTTTTDTTFDMPKTVWRVNSYLKQGYDQTLDTMWDELADNIYDQTGGLLELQIHWNNELGINAEDALLALKNGVIEVSSVTPSKLSGIVPGFSYESVAYIYGEPITDWQAFADAEAARRPIFEEVLQEFDCKLLALYMQPPQLSGSTDIMSTKPLYSVSDLKGLLLRASSKDSGDFWASLGATYVPTAAADMYMALKTKVIDAVAQPADALITYKFAEITPYLIKVLPQKDKYFQYGWAVSESAFNELPPEVQKIVVDNFAAYQAEADAFISGMGTTYLPPRDAEIAKTIADYNITVIEFPESDHATILNAAEVKIIQWLRDTDEIGIRLFKSDMEVLGRMDRYERLMTEAGRTLE